MESNDLLTALDSVSTLFGLLPPSWIVIAGKLMLALAALRTLMRGAVAFFSALDSVDGRTDWAWPGKLADLLDKADKVLARLPVKSFWLLEKRSHAAPSKAVSALKAGK